MSNLIAALINKITIRWLSRNEMENLKLRDLFYSKYGIEVGLYSYGCFDRWRIPPGTKIGRYCSFAKSARILDANHPIASLSTHPFLYAPSMGVVPEDRLTYTHCVIADDVWLSHNVTISPGCASIGRGAIIGAGAVVTSNVPAYAIMVGSPARVLRMRFTPDQIAAIEASQWWKLDKADMAKAVRKNPEGWFNPTAATLGASS